MNRDDLEKVDNNIIRKLQEDAKKNGEIKNINQLTLVLKNRLPDLKNAFYETDINRTGYVNFSSFDQVIKRLQISENLFSDVNIKAVYNRYQADSHKLNYQSFLKKLDDFKFHYDQEYKEQEESGTQKKRTRSLAELRNGVKQLEIDVVDCRTLPFNMAMNVHTRSKKVGQAIKRFFPTKEDLNEYLKNSLNIPADKIDGHCVSKEEFKGIVNNLFKNFEINFLNSKDFEGFYSSILYNKNGFTNFEEVHKTIYR